MNFKLNLSALGAVIASLALSGALTPLVPKQFQGFAAVLPTIVAAAAPAVVKKVEEQATVAAQSNDPINAMLQGIAVSVLQNAAAQNAAAQSAAAPATLTASAQPASTSSGSNS